MARSMRCPILPSWSAPGASPCLIYLGYLISAGLDPSNLPFAQHWASLAAVFLYFSGLIALWFVKSPRANLFLLLFMIAVLVIGTLAPTL